MDLNSFDFAVRGFFILTFVFILLAGAFASTNLPVTIGMLIAAFVSNGIGYIVVAVRDLLVRDN